jgi:hypothetical protein
MNDKKNENLPVDDHFLCTISGDNKIFIADFKIHFFSADEAFILFAAESAFMNSPLGTVSNQIVWIRICSRFILNTVRSAQNSFHSARNFSISLSPPICDISHIFSFARRSQGIILFSESKPGVVLSLFKNCMNHNLKDLHPSGEKDNKKR